MVWRDIPHFYPIFLLAIARNSNFERMCAARTEHGEYDTSVCAAVAAYCRTCRSGASICDGVVKYDRLIPLQSWECVSMQFVHLGISLQSCTMLVPLYSIYCRVVRANVRWADYVQCWRPKWIAIRWNVRCKLCLFIMNFRRPFSIIDYRNCIQTYVVVRRLCAIWPAILSALHTLPCFVPLNELFMCFVAKSKQNQNGILENAELSIVDHFLLHFCKPRNLFIFSSVQLLLVVDTNPFSPDWFRSKNKLVFGRYTPRSVVNWKWEWV